MQRFDSATPPKPIQDIHVGDRVAGRNPLREQAWDVEIDPATWRRISLRMTKESGHGLSIELLRPLTWIEGHDVQPGETIFIDLPEMGAVGDAEVTALGLCPQISPGEGTVVTGTFKHQADENSSVVNLRLEDQIDLTGVTANHPYWSEDRQDFVEAGNLQRNEIVDTHYGRKRVVPVTPIEHNGYLYNLETTEHVYRVGALGALVHNSCIVPSKTHTLDLGNSAWRRTTFSDDGLVYVLRDTRTNELLKVGQTTSSTFIGRFEKYAAAARRNRRELSLDVFEVPLAQRGAIEGGIRRTLGSMFPLRWDNTGRRLGFPGPGVP